MQVQALFLNQPKLFEMVLGVMAFAPRLARTLGRQPAALDGVRVYDASGRALAHIHLPEIRQAIAFQRVADQVHVTGGRRVVFLENQMRGPVAGFHVHTLFLPEEGGPGILVNRGWVPVAADMQEPFYHVYGGTQDNGSWGGPIGTRFDDGISNEDLHPRRAFKYAVS